MAHAGGAPPLDGGYAIEAPPASAGAGRPPPELLLGQEAPTHAPAASQVSRGAAASCGGLAADSGYALCRGPAQALPSPEPVPPGAKAFAQALRRRPLPAELTEERQQELGDVVFNCVAALYEDRIRPVLGAVQRRLREVLTAAGWQRGPLEADVQAMVLLCARDGRFALDPPMLGDPPVVRLAEEPAFFRGWVDVEAPEDTYKQSMWDAFSAFLVGTGGAAPVSLPSDPHAAAQELHRRQLAFFRGLALGEVEHVVRLAIGRRRLLCYLGDTLRSGRMVKASPHKEASKGKVDGVSRGDIRDVEDLVLVLLSVMEKFPDGLPLSLLKQNILG
ncbi:unnamed protein product, partial [Prorocentrum cordatum]